MPPSASPAGGDQTRAAEAERELQEFSYIVSHDLAASSRHVAEFSRLLLGELGEGLTDRQQALADRIRSATEKSRLMMEELLAFSRVQQKALEVVRQDAAPALRLAMLQLAIGEASGIEVSVEPLGEVCADTKLLGMALHHLLDNAIKFRRPEIAPRIAVHVADDEEFWRLRITDNGPGVEPAYREKAFRMFHRLNGEDTYPGVGAGLTICRRIARRHGGEAAFLDCADGACVELALPHAPRFQ
ncbi:MAG: phytochrome two-component sensor histidine kinase [Phenylobacterium sp.]|uniref:sensor histidine kinase n=1 Tax=Phenylobacterium sp. TaxID=1871053 RepID=UPI002615E46E|nr:ATP-binding protein [Phenylobacterium sp.]MDB5497934.1 phytochrome two-component sensor histidine kinase [Phenylobacterium sp.]